MTCADCKHYAGNGKCRKNKKGTTSPMKVADELSCFQVAEPEKPVLPEEKKPETKVCKGCGRELPLDAFWHNRQGPTGYCKDCMKEKRKPGKKDDIPVVRMTPEEIEERRKAEREQAVIHVDPVPPISTFSVGELAQELHRRGFHGTLTRNETINI